MRASEGFPAGDRSSENTIMNAAPQILTPVAIPIVRRAMILRRLYLYATCSQNRSARRFGSVGQHIEIFQKSGAGEGIRTLDPKLGKVVWIRVSCCK